MAEKNISGSGATQTGTATSVLTISQPAPCGGPVVTRPPGVGTPAPSHTSPSHIGPSTAPARRTIRQPQPDPAACLRKPGPDLLTGVTRGSRRPAGRLG